MKRLMGVGIVLLVTAICATRGPAQGALMPGPVEVTGKLVRMMAIGAESSGWAIEFEQEQAFGGNPVKSLEVEGKASKLEKLENKMVKASGNLVHRSGVESHDRTVLRVEKIKEVKPKS